jgi:hypothetical protein
MPLLLRKRKRQDLLKRARLSAAAKKQWEDPSVRAKISKKIVVTSLLTRKVTKYASGREAHRKTGFSKATITECCKARQVAFAEYSIRYETESDELKRKHDGMLNILTHTPCDVQTREGRHLRSFSSAVEAVRWLRDEKQLNPNFFTMYKALTGKSKGFYGERHRQVRITLGAA